jgi:alpha-tubulin suppressor-like RCC1 family protein
VAVPWVHPGGPREGTEKPAHVAVGKRHSLLLTSRGRVWSFGHGLYHALGHGTTDSEWSPKLVRFEQEPC